MTTARILGSLPEGSSFTSSVNRRILEELKRKGASERLRVLVEIEPMGHGFRKTAKGVHEHIELQIAMAEILDRSEGDDVDRFDHMAQKTRERRHTPGQQLTVTGDSEADRLELLRELQQWADDTGRDLDAEWDVYYDPEHVARPDKASPLQLREFAHKHGLVDVAPVADEVDGEDLDAEEDDDDGDGDGDDDDGGGELPVEDVALPAFIEPEPVSS